MNYISKGNTGYVFFSRIYSFVVALCCASLVLLSGCAQVNVPGARNVTIPSPAMAEKRREAVNDRPDSVLYLPLGSDVLVPQSIGGTGLPSEYVGPFELRSETLAGALQLILADYEIPMAFESEEGLTRTLTVTNLAGPMNQIVRRVCGLVDLYCSYESGILVVKESQIFTVTVPPVGRDNGYITALASGLDTITGGSSTTEETTRTIVYEVTNRTAPLVERYLQRIRANTALIVFEVYIWEVALNTDNATGIQWENLDSLGKFFSNIDIPGGTGAAFTPISIGLPTTSKAAVGGDDVLQFISNYGAVKTISQPQITMLSGSESTLRAADTVNYVSSLSRSVENNEVTVSTSTDSVDTGFTLTIGAEWDRSTIYANIDIDLQDFLGFQEFDADGTTLQLPETTERELSTQVRIRPGDSLLIAGLVREVDNMDMSGPGFNAPFFPTSRSATVSNTELVFLLKPRVIVYTSGRDSGDSMAFSSPDGVSRGGFDGLKIPLPRPTNAYSGGVSVFSTLPAGLLDPSLSP